MVAVATALVTFLLLKSDSDNWLLAGMIAGGMFLYLLVYAFLDRFLGSKRQEKIFDSDAFMYLRTKGFRKIYKGELPTLQGEYNDFHLMVYYSNEEDFKGRIGRNLVIVAKCNYPVDGSVRRFEEYLESNYKKHKTGYFKTYTLEWYKDSVVCKLSLGIFNPKQGRVIKSLDRFTRILRNENIETVPFLDQ